MKKPSIGRIFEAVSGILIMAVAAVLASIDMLFLPNTDLFGTWGGKVEMALPTAACFVLTGSVIILIAGRRSSDK